MAESKNSVDYRFKILYAIGMILVCCDHTSGGGITLLTDWFPYGGTHLALFMFCSGYFYKKSAEGAPGKYFIKKIKNLILPFYAYTIVYGLIVCLLKTRGFQIGADFTAYNVILAPILYGSQFVYNMGGWFIIPLFMVEMYHLLLRKMLGLCKKDIPEIVFFIIHIIVGLLGNELAGRGMNTGWWLVLVRMCYFIPFYGLGVFYKRSLEKYDRKIPTFFYLALVMTSKLAIVLYFGKMISYNPGFCNNFTEGPLLPIIIGYQGIALWLRIACILEPVIGRSRWINLIADNTFSIMMNQFLGFMLVKAGYALLNKTFAVFSDFDWVGFKTDVWWYYQPKGLEYSLMIYVVAGIVFSILIQKMIDRIKKLVMSRFA